MHFKTTPFSAPQEVETTSDIQSLSFKDGELTVSIVKELLSSGKVAGVRVRFHSVQGFRFLDEADLARYWVSNGVTHNHHVLKVDEGGWASEENYFNGYSNNRSEWLIVTGNACVSVFSVAEPIFTEVELAFNA